MGMADLLNVERHEEDGVAFLCLRGELDIATAGQVPESVARLVRDGQVRIVVDLRRVSLIDSVGVRSLLHIRRRVWRNDGVVAFVCGEEPTGRVLRVMGLYDALECTADLEAAATRVRTAPGPPASSTG
jgi:anti-sigma B factor antagonist